LAEIWRAAKATKVPAREAIATLICMRLEEILGPSVPLIRRGPQRRRSSRSGWRSA
jgi:hypothetical protein